ATVLVGFVILVGPMPTVARASAMGMIALAGMALGRPGSATGALALVTMGLLITHPTYAADIGFALSVSATFAVLTL
ncbi:ComEC/Rec2 family competence protein, partial [Streptococcus agalactiae]